MSVTRHLAEYAVAGKYEDLPQAVVSHTKLAVMNTLAAVLGGCKTHLGEMHVNLARQTGGGRADATILGVGSQVSTAMAAYANASLAFALDYEDVVLYTIHAGPVAIPAALAVAQQVEASGKDLILAVERGYEVGTRIGLAMQPSPERGAKVWGQQYTPFAACVSAGCLLNLNVEQMDAAMGITGTYAPVPSAYKYFGRVAETRPMREAKLGWGWMALGGTFGALSANQGFTGGFGILDGDEGFWIMAGSDRCQHEKMLENLGQTNLILETEFKVHPSIAWNHPPYTALKRLMAEHGFDAKDVERIRVQGLGADRIADYSPSGAVDAMFSLPYTLATTLLQDPLLPAMYDQQRIQSKEIRELLHRIEVTPDPKAELAWFNDHRMCFALEIKLKDGRSIKGYTEYPRDKPEMGWPQIEQKFRQLAGQLLSDSQVNRAIELIGELEKVDNVATLVEALVSKP